MKNKIIVTVLALAMCMSFTACGTSSDSSSSKAVNKADNSSSEPQKSVTLFEVADWATSDIWNDGFCEISYYVKNGKGATGKDIDINFVIDNLKIAVEKKTDYDNYIQSLDDSVAEQKQLKDAWGKMIEQIDILYKSATSKTPAVGDKFDTALFNQYFQSFYKLSTSISDPKIK